MGRGHLAVLVSIALGAASFGCKPLYGNKPERLANPSRKKPPPELPDAQTEVKYVEDCTANFRDDPKTAQKQTKQSTLLTEDGDTALANASKAKDPASQAELIKLSIDKYRNALIKDPYNQEATLKLAVAYDMVLRKGCALAMLKRLASMQGNPLYAKRANQLADSVTDNSSWFKGYRKDAISAVGR